MKTFLPLTKKFDKIIYAISLAGGRFIFVGGCVRDTLLDIPPKDYDAEVYGLTMEKLQQVLESLDHVNLVGKSFGVFKMTHYPIDISLPRLDQKTGPGHKGFSIHIDYTLSFKQAARRRDLTMNSMGYDPIENKVLDPYNGRKDIQDKVLHATNPITFIEDPLRVLRVGQFAARFAMSAHPSLVSLCSKINLKELPAERILEELTKLFLKGKQPSLGLEFLYDCNAIHSLFRELCTLSNKEWIDTLHSVDAAAKIQSTEKSLLRMLCLFLAHLSLEKAQAIIKRIKIPKYMEKQLVLLLNELSSLKVAQFLYQKKSTYLWVGYRLYLQKLSWKDLLWIAKYYRPIPDYAQLAEQVLASGSVHKKNLTPIVQGEHLLQKNVSPGKSFKTILDKCLSIQFETGLKDAEKILKICLK